MALLGRRRSQSNVRCPMPNVGWRFFLGFRSSTDLGLWTLDFGHPGPLLLRQLHRPERSFMFQWNDFGVRPLGANEFCHSAAETRLVQQHPTGEDELYALTPLHEAGGASDGVFRQALCG